jgi:hypothetical protein
VNASVMRRECYSDEEERMLLNEEERMVLW